MNAGGVPNACKSNGVAPSGAKPSGRRLSNAWATCPRERDNCGKLQLIPYTFPCINVREEMIYRSGMGPRPIR